MRPADILLCVLSALMTTLGLTVVKMVAPDMVWTLDPLPPWSQLLAMGAAAFVYFSGLGVWVLAMGRAPFSVAYPVGIGLSLASSTLGAAVALGEHVGWLKLAGLALILSGAALLSRKPPAHD